MYSNGNRKRDAERKGRIIPASFRFRAPRRATLLADVKGRLPTSFSSAVPCSADRKEGTASSKEFQRRSRQRTSVNSPGESVASAQRPFYSLAAPDAEIKHRARTRGHGVNAGMILPRASRKHVTAEENHWESRRAAKNTPLYWKLLPLLVFPEARLKFLEGFIYEGELDLEHLLVRIFFFIRLVSVSMDALSFG